MVTQKPAADPGTAPGSGTIRIEQTAVVGDEQDGLRLDAAAARLFTDFSRSRLQDWIDAGDLRVDGRTARRRDLVRSGMCLSLSADSEAEVDWGGEDIPLSLCFEDEHLLVVDKPAGLVVHPGAGNPRGTLVNALLAHRPSLAHLPRAGIVHRLDKDTSGLLVVAASELAHRSLVEQLQSKSMQREYFAVARGRLSGGGRVDAPIGRHPRQRTRMAVVAHGGKPAVTHYRIAERFAHYTALAVQLETGRTHQIRVHLAHRGYPLLGDPVYGGRFQRPAGADDAFVDALRAFGRQALHARRLSFAHPARGEECEFESPLAPDLLALLETLREHDAFDSALT
ncbi:MAG: 23S rRNA pseudouridine(1911/1915/1917) synthase RluD [Halieaceae bacterium]|jgi:23S rRNA pseudouridine1911/1915/1917 synthase|nr:23S rRNA pseudouridine(1911/1915/1917) synthase RluD [Halieaceae bacterium]